MTPTGPLAPGPGPELSERWLRALYDSPQVFSALLDPSGTLFLSSCAFYVGADDLLDAARIAAGEARRRVEVLDVTYQPADHPWILQAPETLYLKTLILRVE